RARSVAPIPLFLPWVAEQVVAVRLPEPRLVLVPESEAAYPLRALPEVQVRNEQPRWASVFGLERLSVVAERDPGLAVGDVLEREVRRVAAVAEGEEIRRVVLDAVEEGVDGDSLPDRVELRQFRHAVDVSGRRLARQFAELVPAPGDGLGPALHRERP